MPNGATSSRSPQEAAQRIEDACPLAHDLGVLVCVCLNCYEAALRSAEQRSREHGIEEAARPWREAVRVYFEETERCEECGVLPWDGREFVARCKACDHLRALLSAEPKATPPSTSEKGLLEALRAAHWLLDTAQRNYGTTWRQTTMGRQLDASIAAALSGNATQGHCPRCGHYKNHGGCACPPPSPSAAAATEEAK